MGLFKRQLYTFYLGTVLKKIHCEGKVWCFKLPTRIFIFRLLINKSNNFFTKLLLTVNRSRPTESLIFPTIPSLHHDPPPIRPCVTRLCIGSINFCRVLLKSSASGKKVSRTDSDLYYRNAFVSGNHVPTKKQNYPFLCLKLKKKSTSTLW